MVATDVASRGIGMIKTKSHLLIPPLPPQLTVCILVMVLCSLYVMLCAYHSLLTWSRYFCSLFAENFWKSLQCSALLFLFCPPVRTSWVALTE